MGWIVLDSYMGGTLSVEPIRTVEPQARIVHGPGAVSEVGEALLGLGVRRPMLVAGKNVAAAGLTDEVAKRLSEVFVFDDVRPNPDVALVNAAASAYHEAGCDGLVALGGGSAMDLAKAAGVVATNGGAISDYELAEMTAPIPPLVAIPTTSGTGSEVTLWAVVTDESRRLKFNVGGTPLISPRVALVDPELTLGMSPRLTAATGMDALSHGIECYTCEYHQPFNDAVSLAAIEFAARWLLRAVEDGSDLEARTQMAHAATFGGLAYGTESAGAAHAMSQSAGGFHECSHGELTARVLGAVCEFNAPADPVRYARVASAMGVETTGLSDTEASLAGVEEVHRLTKASGIPGMEELGFSEEEIPHLARIAREDPQTVGNPREVTEEDYAGIYRQAFAG